MVASVIYCSVCDQPHFLWIPFVILLVFLVRGVVRADGNAEHIEALADQAYLLAFSGTMSALLGLIGRVYLNGGEADDLMSAESMGAVALVMTLVGILSMVTLKEYAQKLADEGSPLKVPTDLGALELQAATSIRPNGGGSTDYESVAQVNRKVVQLIDQTAEHLATLPAAAEALLSTLNHAHNISTEFVSDVEEMRAVMDEFERLQERVLDVEVPT
jgi:hypothetical protein